MEINHYRQSNCQGTDDAWQAAQFTQDNELTQVPNSYALTDRPSSRVNSSNCPVGGGTAAVKESPVKPLQTNGLQPPHPQLCTQSD